MVKEVHVFRVEITIPETSINKEIHCCVTDGKRDNFELDSPSVRAIAIGGWVISHLHKQEDTVQFFDHTWEYGGWQTISQEDYIIERKMIRAKNYPESVKGKM